MPLLKIFHVFNVDQIDGLPSEYRSAPAADPDWDASAAAEQVITGSGATILNQGSGRSTARRATGSTCRCAAPSPTRGAYYATALHELCHWTGHPSRLGRKLGSRFGESAYAMEELIAELGSAFLCRRTAASTGGCSTRRTSRPGSTSCAETSAQCSSPPHKRRRRRITCSSRRASSTRSRRSQLAA